MERTSEDWLKIVTNKLIRELDSSLKPVCSVRAQPVHCGNGEMVRLEVLCSWSELPRPNKIYLDFFCDSEILLDKAGIKYLARETLLHSIGRMFKEHEVLDRFRLDILKDDVV